MPLLFWTFIISFLCWHWNLISRIPDPLYWGNYLIVQSIWSVLAKKTCKYNSQLLMRVMGCYSLGLLGVWGLRSICPICNAHIPTTLVFVCHELHFIVCIMCIHYHIHIRLHKNKTWGSRCNCSPDTHENKLLLFGFSHHKTLLCFPDMFV